MLFVNFIPNDNQQNKYEYLCKSIQQSHLQPLFFDKLLFLEYPSIGIAATGMPSSCI